MILFSSRKLEKALAEGNLSNWVKTKYIIVPAVIMSLFSLPYIFQPIYGERIPLLNSFFNFIFVITGAFITYFGIKKCFQTNETFDRRNFFKRFFVLSVPVLMKLIIIVFPLTIIAGICAYRLRVIHPTIYKRFPIALSLLGPVITYIYYRLINASLIRLTNLIKGKDGDQ